MRQNPGLLDDYVEDAYTMVASRIANGEGIDFMIAFPGASMEAIEYVLIEGIAFPEDFDYATGEVEG